MGWLIIFVVIGILMGIYSYKKELASYNEKEMFWYTKPKPTISSNIRMFVILGLIVGLICWGILGCILTSTIFKTEEYLSYETTITSFKDSQNTTYISRRRIDEDLRYYYYANTSKGKTACWVSADKCNVYIQEGDLTPKVERYSKRVVGFAKYFGINGVLEEDYIFYVPAGTCIDEFNADME